TDAARYQQQPAAATNVRVPLDATTKAKPGNAPATNASASGAAPAKAAATNAAPTNGVSANAPSANTPAATNHAHSTNAGVSTNALYNNAVPTNAQVGSSFGYRRDPFTRREKFHSGCDIKAHWGQPVGASLPGTVQFAGWYHGYGNMIIIEHGGGVATHYAHLSSFAVEPGQHVQRGSIIGYAGSTGRATSPHLHYEVRIDGSAVNPLDPIALDESSEFFKNVAAARLAQPVQAAQPPKVDPVKPATDRLPATQPPRVDSTKPAGEPGKPATTDQPGGSPTKASSSATAQSAGNDAVLLQERPRRVTPQN